MMNPMTTNRTATPSFLGMSAIARATFIVDRGRNGAAYHTLVGTSAWSPPDR
jgi:hypothetical protein